MESIEGLKKGVIPKLFGDPTRIGEYGLIGDSKEGMAELMDLMGQSPIGGLANKLEGILEGLNQADPKKIAKAPNWLERFTGKVVEVHLRYQVARENLETLIAQASEFAINVRESIKAIDRLIAEHGQEAEQLGIYIAAGQQYLEENPDAGVPTGAVLEFDNPRERFARKLTNLATLQASHEMSLSQMRLTKAQAIDMLDRFEETSRVLVPVWRQHALALTSSTAVSAAQAAEAIKAHEVLTQSFAKSMQLTKTIH